MLHLSSAEMKEHGDKPSASKERILLEQALPYIIGNLNLDFGAVVTDPSTIARAAISRVLKSQGLSDKVREFFFCFYDSTFEF